MYIPNLCYNKFTDGKYSNFLYYLYQNVIMSKETTHGNFKPYHIVQWFPGVFLCYYDITSVTNI